MRRTPISALAAGAAVLALAACGSSQTSNGSSSTAAHAPAARTAGQQSQHCENLAVGYVGTQGATGHMEVTLSLRNLSKQSCRIQGYPWARLRDKLGHALPMDVRQGHGFFPDTMQRPRRVILKPGAQARFGLSFVTNNEYAGAHTCRTAASVEAGISGWSGERLTPVSLRRAPRVTPCGRQFVVSPVYD